ncbi:unnamed protein product [Urochloa decumbens]|uniref:Uncharacterized protein n=1 Tax=Urochloa decumbens TaxID=240449 RepID=A0ABC8Z1V0_9POAL
MVDMKFTKQHGRPRMKVVVLNSDLIPEFVDVVIGEYVYELQFRVEIEGDEINPLLINMDEQPKEDGDKDKKKQLDEANKENNAKINESANPGGKELEKEGSATGKESAPNAIMAATTSALSSSTDPSKVRRTVVLKPTGNADSTKAWVAESFFGQQAHDATPKEIPATTPTRKSKRSTMSADQDSIEKAARLKARKNLKDTNNKGSFQGDTLATVLGSIATH